MPPISTAWAASPDFRWDASSWNGILIQTFYRPEATPWEEANKTRWVLTPFWGPKHSKFKAPVEHGEVKKGAIAAFKVEPKGNSHWLARAAEMRCNKLGGLVRRAACPGPTGMIHILDFRGS